MLKVYKRSFGEVSILCVQGQLVTSDKQTLRDNVEIQAQAKAIFLDLARVSRIDAGGLGLLLELRQEALVNGVEFNLLNVPQSIQKVFEISRLDSVFEILTERTLATAPLQARWAAVLHAAPCV